MTAIRRRYSREFKRKVIQESKNRESVTAVALKYQIHPNLLYRWRLQLQKMGDCAFPGSRNLSKGKPK